MLTIGQMTILYTPKTNNPYAPTKSMLAIIFPEKEMEEVMF